MRPPFGNILSYVRSSKDEFGTYGNISFILKRKRANAEAISTLNADLIRDITVRDKEFTDSICRLDAFYVRGVDKNDVVKGKSDGSLDSLKTLMCAAFDGDVTEDVWSSSVSGVGLSASSEMLSYIDCKRYIGLNGRVRSYLSVSGSVSFEEYTDICSAVRKVSDEMRSCGYKENDLFAAAAFISYLPDKEKRERLAGSDEDVFIRNILTDIDVNIVPDDDQIGAITDDSRNLLLVACAGSGKTTSLAGKLKYLVVRKGVPQDRILVTSFTNMAVKDLKETINGKMRLYPKIGTFHSIARHSFSDEDKGIENFPEARIKNIIKRMSDKDDTRYDPHFFRRLMMFFLLGFSDRRTVNHQNGCSLRDIDGKDEMDLKIKFNSMAMANRMMRCRSINGDWCRNQYEVAVANALSLGGIDYAYYEPKKLEDGSEMYPMFAFKNGTVLDCRQAFEPSHDIKAQCLKNNIRYIEFIYPMKTSECAGLLYQIIPRRADPSINETYRKLLATDDREYYSLFSTLVSNFISLFKINRCRQEDYQRFMKGSFDLRTTLFLQLVRDIHDVYTELLRNERRSDFDDMIADACSSLERMRDSGKKLNYDYIMVDEYQDIAAHRADLIDLIAEVSDARLVVVGDDWQSIYSFAGSRAGYFTEFQRNHEGTEVRKITKTHRNSKELIDIAGGFILRNPTQLKKELRSDKHLKDPIRVVYYENSVDEWTYLCEQLNCILAQMVRDNGPACEVLIITRYSFEIRNIRKSGMFTGAGDRLISNDFPDLDITILTAHRSKGLTYDHVIIASAVDDEYGFPSKVMDDPVLGLLRKRDDSMPYAEERRLFYVALTRTSNEVYILAPIARRSVFVKELCETYDILRCTDLETDDVREMLPVDIEEEPKVQEEEHDVCQLLMVRPDSGRVYYLCGGPVINDYDTDADPLGFADMMACALCTAGEWKILAHDDMARRILARCRLPYNIKVVGQCDSDDAIFIASSVKDLIDSKCKVRIALWHGE